jgi:tripartite ATP-independent transporter DctM subunit
MQEHIAIFLLLAFFAVMIICKLPVTFAMIISTAVVMLYLKIPMMTMVQQMSKSVNSFSLLAIPFFILMGEIMGAGGISDRLLKFANVLVGRLRGGLAHVNVLASMFFGGISGSAVADVSSLGKIEIPMMENAGYDKDFSICVTVSSACQGLLIPPSHNMVLYAMVAGGISVGRLFLAGYIPGVLLGVALMILCGIFAVKRNYPKGEKVTFKEAMLITKDALFAIGAMFIIVGGVCWGFFTATEAAAIGCIYCFLVATLVYKELKLRQMGKILYNAVKTLAMIYSLIAAAGAFGWMMAYLRIPARVTTMLLTVSDNKVVVLLLINLILLVLGCIMDMAPLILITTPILLPVVEKFGMDPVQFGIMIIANLAVGLLTPPVGSCLYAGCAVGNAKIEEVSKALIPFYITMIIVVLMITFIPGLSMWLPNLLMG